MLSNVYGILQTQDVRDKVYIDPNLTKAEAVAASKSFSGAAATAPGTAATSTYHKR